MSAGDDGVKGDGDEESVEMGSEGAEPASGEDDESRSDDDDDDDESRSDDDDDDESRAKRD